MPKKSNSFSDLNLIEAIKAVDNGISKKAFAKQFGVASVLSVEEEKSLVKWLLDCSKKGFPRRREDLQQSVKLFLDDQGRSSPFTNNLPGITWYKAFLKRNPIISQRTSEHVTSAIGNVSEENIKKWFNDIHAYLSDEKLVDILNEPERIFNGDETGFSLCPKTKSVLGPRGAKDIYEIAKGNEKENITAMFTFNAAGQMCNPMIIYKYQRIPQNIIDTIPPHWGVGRLKNNFNCIIPKCNPYFTTCRCSAFRPLKSGWKKGLSEWRNKNPHSSVTKKDFAPILDAVLKTTVKSSTLINGFKACGLFPWNPDQIDYKKCLGKNYFSTINETTTTINIANNIKNLNLKEFSDIIGIETLEKFNNIENIVETENQSEEFFILYRIYEQLKGNQQNSEVDLELEKEKSNADQSNSAIVTTSSSEVELEKEILGTPINHPDTLIKNNKNHIILKKLEISPIESCLIWLVTPERKGTRITERVPYVITSDNWKNLYENKEKKKRSIEEEKEMRKKTREENKILKEIKEIFCIIKTGCCKLCNTDIEQSNLGIECNFCFDKFHQKFANYDSFCDLSSDETLFICESCEKSVIVN
ncbi:unnamed protein product [Macrosiphum euphorbiae]|uniref:HTH CENPB-type domain-containing protein n=1 Tax=Macrosiphum euphorbiae TaxID=13131 RepID=A0AAV0WF82_9HEMI|nr:unnamed protein product [Macrosiphum euphorbiae]